MYGCWLALPAQTVFMQLNEREMDSSLGEKGVTDPITEPGDEYDTLSSLLHSTYLAKINIFCA